MLKKIIGKCSRTVLLLVAGWQMVSAQTPAPTGVIRCYTTESEALRHQTYPQLPSDADFEQWMAKEVASGKYQTPTKASRVIPTVVHVIFSNAGDPDNISDAQVLSQIEILNEDFGRLNADTVNTPAAFQAVAVNSDIEFCLAQIDPAGNPTTGINRVQIAGSPFTTNFVQNTIKPATQWDPTQYFNIWVCNISGGVLGYAQFPEAPGLAGVGTGNGAANTDGIVLLHTSVGRPPANPFGGPYNLGRTATHEVGHWLGLRHIWGDGGCTVDDFCNDTPSSDNPNFGCPTTHQSCGTTDQVQNYMDYTNDACMNLLTADQKVRMDIVLANSVRRASLLTSNVCDLSPEINFVTATTSMTENSASGTTGCRGYQDLDIALGIGGPPTGDATVTLTTVGGTAAANFDYDVLVGSVIFPSGQTANQSFQVRVYDDGATELGENLTIGFAITGTTDAFAGSVNQHTLTVADNDPDPAVAGTGTLFAENFEAGGAGWTVGNASGTNQWAVGGTNGAMNGARSAYISRNGGGSNAYQANNASTSRLISPAINATGRVNLDLSFLFHSNGEINSGTLYDYGALSYSLDGTNFINIVGDASASPFQGVPTNTTYSVALPTACENTTFYLGFDWVNDGSVRNNPAFAVDDIVLTASSSIPVESDLNSMNTEYLGPNATVYWYDQGSGEVMLMVNNMSGHDYGCTQVTIDRAGTGATLYEDPSIAYGCTDKTFLVTPTNNNAGGTFDVRLYYSQAEISGWEAATGQLRASASIAKTAGPIANITPVSPAANGPGNVYAANVSQNGFGTNDFYIEGEFSTGFSGFAAGVPSPGIFPVEFVSVHANWQGEDGLLEWEVASYSHLKSFVVERSRDGGVYERLGEVVPTAPDGRQARFSFVDRGAAGVGAEQLNYRVRAVDFDGAQQWSEVVFLRTTGRVEVLAWPNPFGQSLSVRVHLPEAGPLKIELVNGLGQVVLVREMTGAAGNQQIDLEGVADLPAGMYGLRVTQSTGTSVQRVLKTN